MTWIHWAVVVYLLGIVPAGYVLVLGFAYADATIDDNDGRRILGGALGWPILLFVLAPYYLMVDGLTALARRRRAEMGARR